jgi:putative ABC transport system permease protein
MLRPLYLRLRALWSWRRRESELDEEIAFHLAEEARHRTDAGLASEEAHLAARKDFGNPTLIREAAREAWGWGSAERLIQDARVAFRITRRQPGFSALAVLTLALGIGATTAILNVVNALLLRPLPLPGADRLVVLFATTPKQGITRDTTSFLDFSAWKNDSRAFTAAAAYRTDSFSITGDGVPEPVTGVRASHELFTVLGVSPIIGRPFDQPEQQKNTAVAVISHGLWTRRYGSDPRVLGRTIVLNEVRHSIIGVLPTGFQFPPFTTTDVIVPVAERRCRSCGYIRAIARLKSGVPAAAAQQELDAIAARLAEAFPDSNQGRGVNVVALQDVAVGSVRTPLVMLLGAGLFVLLIGCANVGNLVLARGIARQRELALRSALGAGVGRLVRQLLTESVSLALLAALLGAALAFWGSELLAASLSQRFLLPEISFNWALLAIALLLAVIAGVLCGLPPALMVRRSDLNDSLKQGGHSQSGGATQQRLRNLLVIGETALTVMLLIGAGLLVRSFIRLHQVDLGFNPQRVLTADLLLSRRNANPGRREIVLRELLDSVGGLPGADAVAVLTDPAFREGSRETFTVEDQPDPGPRNGHAAGFNVVSEAFFRAMGIPLVRGRGFDQHDTADAAPVAIINETMARQFWPGGEAIGKRIRFYYDKNPQRWVSVIGIAGNVRYRDGDVTATPKVFVPYQQNPYRSLPYSQDPFVSLVVRTATDPAAMAPAVQARIWAVDKDHTISKLQPMERMLWQSVAVPRIYMLLLGVFAAIALMMATAGIYGLSAYAVVRRTREIGIRMTVGATSGQILALILRQGMVLILTGVGIGVSGSLALTRVMAGFLYGITATDAPTFLAVLLLFAAVAFWSTYIPARRAARIDPTVAFRDE